MALSFAELLSVRKNKSLNCRCNVGHISKLGAKLCLHSLVRNVGITCLRTAVTLSDFC